MKLLDGKQLSAVFQSHIAQYVERHATAVGRAPGLGVILVGENPASQAYVANKERLAVRCGYRTFNTKLPATATQSEVLAVINEYNNNLAVDGILLQLPLPKQLNANPLLDAIDPQKDADGLHPTNQGLLLRGEGSLRSCTPLGCMKLIDLALSPFDAATVKLDSLRPADLSGKSAVVIGRSILVGKPVAMMLLERNADVTIIHSKTKDPAAIVGRADIVIAAVGRPQMVRGDWIKEGALVIDVGINRLESGALVGDVAFDEARPRSAAITPVPGGVGPMTVAMLIYNTLHSYIRRNDLAPISW